MCKRCNIIAIIAVILFITIIISSIGCTTTKCVPIESVRTEYRTKIEKDTLIVRDSIFHKEKGDTVYIEKYKLIYKTKNKNDTIIINDTVPIIQEIEVIREVNKLKNWQIILMILGGAIITIVGYKLCKIIGVY